MSDIQEPLPWGKSSATVVVLEQLVADRLLPRIIDSGAPAWISPRPDETEPKPPQGYVVSFVRLHERGFGVPVSRFMRALCEYYGVELHNFSPNSISQAAVFVAVCEGYLGIEAHWDLWIHLFHGEQRRVESGVVLPSKLQGRAPGSTSARPGGISTSRAR